MTVIYSCTGDGIIVGRVSLLLLLLLLLLLVLPTIAVTNTAAGTTATTTTTTTTTTTGRTTATTTTTSSSTTARARNTCCFIALSDSSTGSMYQTTNKGCMVIPTKNINNYRISNPCQSKRTTITSLCMSTSTDNNNKSTTTTNNIFTKVFSSLWGKGGNDKVKSTGPSVTPSAATSIIEQKKQLLLQAIQNTENGKIATIDEQRTVLQLVRQLELLSPPPTNILQSSTALQNLNGTWYLQYTSPSEIINANNNNNNNNNKDDTDTEEINNNKWVPINPTEGISNIETIDSTKFQAKGTVSAAGIVVDTANKLTTQSINVGTNYVTNTVQVSSDITIIVGGTFRPSDTVPNRVVVAFEIAKIIYQNTITLLDLSFVFAIIAFIRNSRDNGWLETTYLDSSLRIGRGNKGTLFILTKQSNPF